MDLVSKRALLSLLEVNRTVRKNLQEILPKVVDLPATTLRINQIISQVDLEISNILQRLGVS